MWKVLKFALLAVALCVLPAQAMAATPADTLVIAKQIDDIISLDPGEAYELSGIEVIANAYDRIMRFEPAELVLSQALPRSPLVSCAIAVFMSTTEPTTEPRRA